MKPNRSLLRCASLLAALLLFLSVAAMAQESEKPPEGVDSGNYNIKQTAEFGYRWTSSSGNRLVYNTFVNLNPGPRLLEYSLEMRSLNHQGWLFDNLYLTNFGYGGDPNDVTRLRAYKNKWYNFSATFRRDRNFWDYNLLANPLNAPAVIPNAPAGFSPLVNFSPHHNELTRRMGDYNLILMPQSRVRLRLGYSRNINEGPSFTSFHEGTDVLLFQPYKTTSNSYQVGADFKLIPRTNISYDQFLTYYKGDTSWVDRITDIGTFRLSNGTPVDIGLPINLPAGQPCSSPFLAPPPPALPSAPGPYNPACNGYLNYTRSGRVRTFIPTEQLSVQSNYFKNVDFSGRFSYSASDNNLRGYNEFFQGLVTRTRQRQFAISGPASGRRVAVTVDGAVTVHVSEKLRVVDTFRFNHFRLPGMQVFAESSLFGTSMLVPPNIFTPNPLAPPASCPTPTDLGCPQHNASSPADFIIGLSNRFLGQNTKVNTFELEYDFTRRIGARLGYRYGHRKITHSDSTAENLIFFPTLAARGACALVDGELPPDCAQQADGSIRGSAFDSGADLTEINEHSALFGFWTRPVDQVRTSFDLELLSADNTLTRISPRQSQHYKARITWKPVNWASVGGSFNILERRNNVSQIFHRQHSRSYSFNVVMEPIESFGFDAAYDYNDIFSQTNICYTLGFGPLPPGSTPCPIVGSPSPISGLSLYTNKAHFGSANVRWKPIKRLSTHVGLAITSTTGQTTFLAPNAPPGPLEFTYYKPYAGFALEVYRGLFWKGSWGFYEYNEKGAPDVSTPSRFFRTNLVTVAIRYAF